MTDAPTPRMLEALITEALRANRHKPPDETIRYAIALTEHRQATWNRLTEMEKAEMIDRAIRAALQPRDNLAQQARAAWRASVDQIGTNKARTRASEATRLMKLLGIDDDARYTIHQATGRLTVDGIVFDGEAMIGHCPQCGQECKSDSVVWDEEDRELIMRRIGALLEKFVPERSHACPEKAPTPQARITAALEELIANMIDSRTH